MAKKNYPLGCLESGYDPRDYTVAFVSDKYGKLVWPVSDEIPDAYDSYDQEYGTCVAQSLRYGPHRHYKLPFGVNFLYGLARAANAINMPGMSMRTANDFFVKYGLAPLSADPKEYEVPTAVNKAKAAQDALMKAAAPYIGWTYARLMSIDEIKAAIRDRRHITFRMEVSKNGLDKANFFRGDGKNGIGHHAMVILGYGPRVNAKGVTVEAVKVRNSWGEDWGDRGCCYMTWEDVMIKNEIYGFFPPEKADPVPDPIIKPRRSLRKGMSGDDVLELQKLLQKHGYLQGVEIKGNFGRQTREAVIAFQAAAGLDADGIVGPLTWAALEKAPVPVTPVPTPTNRKARFFKRVFEAAAALIGSDYSQSSRYNVHAGGSFDCSIFIYAVFAAAGLPLIQTTAALPAEEFESVTAANDEELARDEDAYITAGSVKELLTSMYQVYADQFDLVYPASINQIGKTLPSPAGLLSSYGAQPGDVAFVNFDSSTTRSNKITHVMMIDRNGAQIIHTANNTDKCTRVPLSYGDKRICAIIRLRDDFVTPELPILQQGDKGVMVRMLQIALNLWNGERLVCDGDFGPKTAAAVLRINGEIGISGAVCTAQTWAALGLPVE